MAYTNYIKNCVKFKIRLKLTSKKIKYVYVWYKQIEKWLTVYVEKIFNSLALAP